MELLIFFLCVIDFKTFWFIRSFPLIFWLYIYIYIYIYIYSKSGLARQASLAIPRVLQMILISKSGLARQASLAIPDLLIFFS
jgi:hypothetical protein